MEMDDVYLSPEDEDAVNKFSDIILCAMATFVTTSGKLDKFREWIKKVAEREGVDPATKAIYETIHKAPDDILVSSVTVAVMEHRAQARNLMGRTGHLLWLRIR
jgi:hypothetical protein